MSKPTREALPLTPNPVDISTISWGSLEPKDWILEFRSALQNVLHEFTAAVRDAMTVYEELEKTHDKYYPDMESSLEELQGLWQKFSTSTEIDGDILRSSPVFFNFQSVITKMKAPMRSGKGEEMQAIRATARQAIKDVAYLQEAALRVLEQYEEDEDGHGSKTIFKCVPALISMPTQPESGTHIGQTPGEEQPAKGTGEEQPAKGTGEVVLTTFQIDAQGRALTHMTASYDTVKEIREALPPHLQQIQFMGHVWRAQALPTLGDVPLFIANAPVLLPVPFSFPRTTLAHVLPRPLDPYPNKLDPLEALPEEAAILALAVFEDADAVFVFFDGSFVVAYPHGINCDDLYQFVPETFGGLTVVLFSHPGAACIQTTSDKGKARASLENIASALIGNTSHGFAPENAPDNSPGNAPDNAPNSSPGNAPDNSHGSAPADTPVNTASDPGKPPSTLISNAQADTELIIQPGYVIKVRGEKFGEPFPEIMAPSDKRLQLFADSRGATGVLLNIAGEVFLTTTTHTTALFGERCRSAKMGIAEKVIWKAAETIVGKHDWEDWKMDVWVDGVKDPVTEFAFQALGLRISNTHQIGKVVRTFDPRAGEGYPRGYDHDLALIKLNQPTRMVHDQELMWNIDPKSLFFNKPIQLLSSTPATVKHGVAFPPEWGTTIGQAIIRKRNSERTVKLGGGVRNGQWAYDSLENHVDKAALAQCNQFARSYLWRTYGFFRSLEGLSGSPLVVHCDEGYPRSIIGFQNFQWVTDPRWKWGDQLEELLICDEEDLTNNRDLLNYAFYGAYFLPAAVKGSSLVNHSEGQE
ncbi:hypothetical protein FN846DRAFT_891425 [Sphaerosporella brunnea]|uniref:Uncharacterized protein n=1 Tax=Sphaerosporella brunnea TaxID=1250544 RepID=A0A5J5ESS9_9PEZI|nr:hypothetical protein FN846DRAFT_891425 [Sphaerosporella brunnea]